MVGEEIEKHLYEAASEGNVTKFLELHKQDRYLIERVSYAGSRNVLHIATMHRQEAIVDEVLKINPQLARNPDSQKSWPLHIAAAQGHVEIAKKLLSEAPEMCWCRDGQGMNPVHVAAVNGCVEILEEILRLDSLPAMERVHRGQTVMHLCVKHRQLEALEVLVKKLDDLVEAKDDDGETLLHWAARSNHDNIIKYLVECPKIDKQSRNSMGKRALKIFKECHSNLEVKDFWISHENKLELRRYLPNSTIIDSNKREQIMVVMVLIATMAFQAAISPPGGFWQEDTSSHRAGEAVMASTHPKIYHTIIRSSVMAFLFSVSTIFLLATENPINKGFLLFFTSYMMLVSLGIISFTFGNSILAIMPNIREELLSRLIVAGVTVFVFIFLSLIFWAKLKARWYFVKQWRLRQSLRGDNV